MKIAYIHPDGTTIEMLKLDGSGEREIVDISGTVALIAPCGGMSHEDVAFKDVPAGVPFVYVKDEDVPTNAAQWADFMPDFTHPDGIGLGHEAWFAEQEAKNKALLDAYLPHYPINPTPEP